MGRYGRRLHDNFADLQYFQPRLHATDGTDSNSRMSDSAE